MFNHDGQSSGGVDGSKCKTGMTKGVKMLEVNSLVGNLKKELSAQPPRPKTFKEDGLLLGYFSPIKKETVHKNSVDTPKR